MNTATHTSTALGDIGAAFKNWRLSWAMARQDIQQRYRGSALGPLWIAASLLAISLAAGILYATIFGQETAYYIPMVTAGMFVWIMVSTTLAEGCNTFIQSSNLMNSVPLPIFTHPLRIFGRTLIIAAHNVVVLILVMVYFRTPFTLYSLTAIAGMALVLVNLLWLIYIFGLLSARYRDFTQIVNYSLTFAIFLTPIFWTAQNVPGGRHVFLDINPFYHMVSSIRGPLIGEVVDPTSWIFLCVMAVVGWTLTVVCHARFRNLVIFWL